jgi:hypothetical protein
MDSRVIADPSGRLPEKMAALYMATQGRTSGNLNVKFTPLKTNIILNYISRFSSYRTVNTLSTDNKKQSTLRREIIALCFQKNTERINVVCGKTELLLHLKVPPGLKGLVFLSRGKVSWNIRGFH